MDFVPDRTITISEEAYNHLVDLRKEGESFTDVIERTVRELTGKPLAGFAGRWKGTSDELNGMLAQIEDAWRICDRNLEVQ
jgi:predicted CopG family antitoxin